VESKANILKYFQFKRIIIPIIIGLGVATFLLYRNLNAERYQKSDAPNADYVWHDSNGNGFPDKNEFIKVEEGHGNYTKMTYKDVLANIKWRKYSLLWVFTSIFLMSMRDLAYIMRLRILTDKKLTWKQCFNCIFLWEFATAVTPSIIGGAPIAMFIINREGISMGKATAIVMVTAFLDELFYILMVPLVFLLVKESSIFPVNADFAFFNSSLGIKGIFFIGYFFILFLTSIITYAIFFNPRGFKWLLLYIFKLPLLKKWRNAANQTGNDLIETSKEMKHKPIVFWLKAFGVTFMSWTARFWVVNSLIMVFITVDQHFLIYARQLIMWIIIHISPTPGSSGIAEFVFSDFLKDFIPIGFSPAIALLWRLISYYPYLFIGFLILPKWFKKTHDRKINITDHPL